MKETTHLKLKKPEQSDPYDIDQVTNLNADILDAEINAIKSVTTDIPNLYVMQKHTGDATITNTVKTYTSAIDAKGISVHNGATASELNLIARISNVEVKLYKPLIVNNRNIETELSNRFTKSESDGRYAFKEDAYLKVESDMKYAFKNDAYLKTDSDIRYVFKNDAYSKTDVYTKIETDSRYPLKGASYLTTEVYTKEEADTKYSLKTATYLKSEVDIKITAVNTEVTNGYRAADVDIRSKANMQKITADNGKGLLILADNGGKDVVTEINAMPQRFFTIEIAKGNIGTPNDTRYWYGTVQTVGSGSDTTIWLTRNTTGGEHSPYLGRIRGGVFQGWLPISTTTTYTGNTPEPSVAIKAQMKKGDIYFYVV